MVYKPTADLSDLITKLLGREKDLFFENIGMQFPHTIRFNTLKSHLPKMRSFLEEQGFLAELFGDFDDIFRLTFQPFPIGKSLSHYLGHIYVQDLASMIPPQVLNPQPGELVLDMAAAPGSKTTQMAVMMKNRGLIVANDVAQKRLRALIQNLQRFGIVNTAVVKNYGESFGNLYFQTFDRILLDPACSGLGTLHKAPEVLSWWTPAHCSRLAASQRHLLSSAIKALKPGGILVYSTCTLTPDENEDVINYALHKLPVELEEIDLPHLRTRKGLESFDGRKYHPEMGNCLRIYPFDNQTEGFFIAKIRKTGDMEKRITKKERKPFILNFISHNTSPVKKYLDYLSSHFGIARESFSQFHYHIDRNITAVSEELADFTFKSKPFASGLTIGRPLRQAGKFTTEGIHLFGSLIKNNKVDITDLGILEKFVNREDPQLQVDGRGQIAVSYKELPIGYGLSDDHRLKSQFPKAEWLYELNSEIGKIER